jgi:hypothetical protein
MNSHKIHKRYTEGRVRKRPLLLIAKVLRRETKARAPLPHDVFRPSWRRCELMGAGHAYVADAAGSNQRRSINRRQTSPRIKDYALQQCYKDERRAL